MKKLFVGVLAMALLTGCSSGATSASKNVTGEIKVYTRDGSSGTREAFEKGIGFKDNLTQKATEVTSNDDMAAKVGASKNGIGYTSLSTDFDKNNIKALMYEGVVASSDTVLDGTYGLQRPFSFVSRASGDYESDDKEQLISAFIDFLQNSAEGMAVVKKAGGEVDTSKAQPWDELASKYDVLKKDNSSITITTAGSTSVDKTLKAALETFSPMAGNFQIVMKQTGSSDGVKRVIGSEKDGVNRSDIGFASREFEGEELDLITNAMASGQYCVDAVVAVVHKDNNDFETMSKDQLQSIFTGTVVNWEDIK